MDAALANQITSLDEACACITQLRNEFQQSLAALQTENKLLRQKLALFLQRYFGGTKNERLDPKQLELLLAGLGALSAPAPVAEKPAPPRTPTARAVRQPLPAHLETERVVLDPSRFSSSPPAGADWARKSPRNWTGSRRSSSSASTSGPSMPTPNASSSRPCPRG